jgi:hypothetical protein
MLGGLQTTEYIIRQADGFSDSTTTINRPYVPNTNSCWYQIFINICSYYQIFHLVFFHV